MAESTIYLNRLYLFGKPMMLLHTLASFAINAVAVAILMLIYALQVPSSDNVAPALKVDIYCSCSPFMGTLALVLFLLFSMMLDLYL